VSRAPREETELSDVETALVDVTGEEQDAVLLFVGGPLDGRVEVRAARHGAPLPTVTHVHLHGGPKVVSRYDLQPLPGSAGVYHLRPRSGSPAATPPPADDDRTG
jgi:hypothetical protein